MFRMTIPYNNALAEKDNELELYKKRLKIALESAGICIFEVDLTRQLYIYFENAEGIFGVPGEAILKDVAPFSKLSADEYRRKVSEYFSHPEDEAAIAAAFVNVLNGKSAIYEARMRAGGSQFVWCRIHVTPVLENGRPVKMIGVITDNTDVKLKTDRLAYEATLDGFTGLLNKQSILSAIRSHIQQDNSAPFALVLLDIDRFKAVNDSYGHDSGDKIIHALALQIRRIFGGTALTGRFGGDEFIAFVPNDAGKDVLIRRIQPLTRISVEQIDVTVSAGVACYPEDDITFEGIFRKADQSLYYAKSLTEHIAFYPPPPNSLTFIFRQFSRFSAKCIDLFIFFCYTDFRTA